MANLVTMAGKGTRFSKEGYILPKALIETSGRPMVQKVIETLPESDNWVFVVRQEHIDELKIDKVIQEMIPNAICVVDTDMIGQASIFCAQQYLKEDEPVLIAGCDCGLLYNLEKFNKIVDEKEFDCVMWTATEEQRFRDKPESWGYVVPGNDEKTVERMSVKVPISNDPYYDHVVTATFWVSSAKLLFEAIQTMIDKNIKTNSEYYLDNLPVALKELNKKSTFFDIDLYISWGTPKELHEYEELQYYYKYLSLDKIIKDEKKLKQWERYFNTFEK